MANRFCYNCGAPLQEGAKFCISCGTPVLPAEPPVAAEPEVVPVTPVAVEPEAPVTEVLDAVQEEAPLEPEAAPAVEETVSLVDETAVILEEPAPVVEEPAPAYIPPEPAYIPPEPAAPVATAAAPKKIKGYRKRGAWRTVAAIPLCILIFIFSFASLLVWDVNQIFQGEQLAEVITDTIDNMDLTEIKAVDVVGDKMDIENKDDSIIEWAIAEIAETSEGTIDVTEKDVRKFLKESTIYPFITEVLNAYTDEFFKNGDEASVSKKELTKLFEENAELAEEIFGVKVGDKEIEYFVNSLEESGVLETLEPGGMKHALGGVYDAFQYVQYLIVALIVFLLLTALFIFLLALNNRNILRTCGDVGILLTIIGVMMTAVALAGNLIASLIPGESIALTLVTTLLDSFLMSTLIPALAVLGLGVVLIVAQIVGKKILVKSAKKQA